jgi:hypothetical protein
MGLSREEIEAIGSSIAQDVLENIHRYTVEYKEPKSIAQGLQDSMVEEKTADDWYMKRAKHAREHGDENTAGLYEHIAGEERNHYEEFRIQLVSNVLPHMAGHIAGNPNRPYLESHTIFVLQNKKNGLYYSGHDKAETGVIHEAAFYPGARLMGMNFKWEDNYKAVEYKS